jgi:hypothetical protein
MNNENINININNFNTELMKFLSIYIIYLNKDYEIFKIHKEVYTFQNPGKLTREEIINIIKTNMISNKIKYSLFSILKFNVNIESSNIQSFISNDSNILSLKDEYFEVIKRIDTINFDKSITFFHNLNSLFIIFNEKLQKENNNINNANLQNTNIHINKKNNTKRIFISSNFKKTKRKQFKDIKP